MPRKGPEMNGMYELFRDKPQEIVSMRVYYQLGELDFSQLQKLAESCPEYQEVVKQSFEVGPTENLNYYLVPVELVLAASAA
jgi:hypothetical protein